MPGLLRFTPDLFGNGTGVAPSAVPAVAVAQDRGLALFAHPRATREVRLGDVRVAYEFTRGKRRTIGFVVGADGLSVRAPQGVALRDVETAVREKAAWILRKLAETRQRHARLEATRIDWKDGVSFPFLGRAVVVRLDPTCPARAGGAVFDAGDVACGAIDGAAPGILRLALRADARGEQIRDAVRSWLTRQARRIFIERLDHFAPRLGVHWKTLALSSAATRWGSASSSGAIRLHWRLVHFRMPVIDYVVAHELSHLRVMNHSPRFWATVASVIPDYGVLRLQLKDEAIPRW